MWESLSNFWVILKRNPSSVNNFVRNINGKRPGKTEKKKSFKPDIVPDVYLFGFAVIKSIIIKISRVKIESCKFSLLKKDFNKQVFLVVLITKYMLELNW